MDHPVIHWLMNDGRKIPELSAFLEAFAGQLRQAGVDVARITTGVPILHPQIVSFSGLWRLGAGVSERLYQHDDNVRRAQRKPDPGRVQRRRAGAMPPDRPAG